MSGQPLRRRVDKTGVGMTSSGGPRPAAQTPVRHSFAEHGVARQLTARGVPRQHDRELHGIRIRPEGLQGDGTALRENRGVRRGHHPRRRGSRRAPPGGAGDRVGITTVETLDRVPRRAGMGQGGRERGAQGSRSRRPRADTAPDRTSRVRRTRNRAATAGPAGRRALRAAPTTARRTGRGGTQRSCGHCGKGLRHRPHRGRRSARRARGRYRSGLRGRTRGTRAGRLIYREHAPCALRYPTR